MRDYCEDETLKVQYEYGVLVAVFDGHNGGIVSKYCVNNLVRVLDELKNIYEQDYNLNLNSHSDMWYEIIGHCLINLNNEILNKYDIPADCGTTGVVAYVSFLNGTVYVANVGDTRCMIVDSRTGKIMNKICDTDISMYDMEYHALKDILEDTLKHEHENKNKNKNENEIKDEIKDESKHQVSCPLIEFVTRSHGYFIESPDIYDYTY